MYGHGNALHEKRTIEAGVVNFVSTSWEPGQPVGSMSLKEAVDRGLFKPRFVAPIYPESE